MTTPTRPTLTKTLSACILSFLAISMADAATNREIAADEAIRIEVAENYICHDSVPLLIQAPSVRLYDAETERVQRLVNAARMVISFECERVTTFPVRGLVNEFEYFKASSAQANQWKLVVEPDELSNGFEKLLSLKENPEKAAALAVRLIQKFKTIPGATSTQAFKKIGGFARTLIDQSIGTTETDLYGYFGSVLQETSSEQTANARFDAFEKTLTEFSPDRLPLFKAGRQRIVAAVLEDLAQKRLAENLANPSGDLPSLLIRIHPIVEQDALNKQVQQTMRQQAMSHIDSRFLTPLAVDEELSWLSDVAYSVDTAKALRKKLAGVPASPLKDAVLEQVNQVLKQGLSRLGDIRKKAQYAINELDAPYEDLGGLLEASEQIAAEFEETGFRTIATSLRRGATRRGEAILARDFPLFEQALRTYPSDQASLATLEWQKEAFSELSTDIPGFSAYAQATEKTIEAMRPLVCAGIARMIATRLGSPGHSEANTIGTGTDEGMSLLDFVCSAQANGYQIENVTQAGADNKIKMSIRDQADSVLTYRLGLAELADATTKLIGDQIVTNSGEAPEALSLDAWFEHIATITGSGYSGEPDEAGITACDKFAADPFDRQRRTEGQAWSEDNLDFDRLDKALDACIAAVEFRPGDITQVYQLGRMLMLRGDEADARYFLTKASRQAYSPAMAQLAGIVMNEEGREDAFYDAVDLYRIAARKKYKPAVAMMKELEPDGQEIYRPLPAPTERQLASAFPDGDCVSNFGVQVCKRVVGSEIKSCFQTSANKFSCEWRPIMRCSTNVSSAHSMILQQACNNTEFGFGDFRKNKNGSWTFISG